jgi:dGTPase
VQQATFAATEGPFVRYAGDLVIPGDTWAEITVLKGIAAHYVMEAADRVALQVRQRELLAALVEVLLDRGPDALDEMYAADWLAAPDDAARTRVVIDQVASLTDASAVAWHDRLLG